jgi:endonuclease YncB( thermonuclease family)
MPKTLKDYEDLVFEEGVTPYVYKVLDIEAIDGDTVKAVIDLGFNVSHTCRMRLWGINAPEISTEAGADAKCYLVGAIGIGPIVVRTLKDKEDKYGRMLCILYWQIDGNQYSCINTEMLDDGMAVEYYGGKR